jgi:hypothetical protein
MADAARAQTDLFAECARPANATLSYDDLVCFYRVGRQHKAVPQARARLRALGGGTAQRPWATLVLAHATLEEDEPRAITLYELAADGFTRSKEAEGEVIARQNLRNLYQRHGARELAARQVERAVAAAEAAQVPLTMARASVLQSSHVIETGGDIASAHRALLRAERLAFPGGPIGLRRSILFTLATTSLHLGRLDEAIDALERHQTLRQEDGSTIDASSVAFNLLNARLTLGEERPLPGARARLLANAEEVLAESQRLSRPAIEAQTHRVLGDLLRSSDPGRATEHLSRCLELEASIRQPSLRASCLWSLSQHEASLHPERADALSREALALVGARHGSPLLAYAWQSRLRLVWRTQPEERAIAESLQALDAIERLRSAQRDEAGRAAVFGNWTRDYYWLAGQLLQADPPRLDQAFAIGERLRARVLLEHLGRAGLPGARATDDDRGRALAAAIAATQRQLLAPASDSERSLLLDRLQLLESERADASAGALPPATLIFASIDRVQQALDESEAMLWFSIGPWKDLYDDFGGGAWVVAITRRGITTHALSAGPELTSQIAALTGLMRLRDTPASAWTPAADDLGRTLFGGALAALPPDIARLVVISDGALHRLPFDALRPDEQVTRLGERFEISVLPSATLWLQLRESRAARVPASAVVLADPELPQVQSGSALRLAPLPWARREADAIAEQLGLPEHAVLKGPAASERALKDRALGEIGLVHLAAHARADDRFPERSAVFLAAGEADEDGWLQPREIAALDLRGRVVVLSACDSAEGALVNGEGSLSLARAFFAGGASTVIATRWPLRDDDAATVMEAFYRALAGGVSVGTALRQAKQEAIAAGLPAAVWAGIALLGDGTVAPIRRYEPPIARPAIAVLSGVVLIVALALALQRRVAR